MARPLYLASTSTYRSALLGRLGIPFEAVPPEVDERALPGESPRTLSMRLAGEKALAVAARFPAAVVVGSDQVCCLDGAALGKPGSVQRARDQLRAASGRQVDFFTAVSVAWDGGERRVDRLDHTRVRFRRLRDEVISEYVEREQPLDCAGAFKAEGLGIALFETVTSDDPTALIGLPLIALTSLLAAAGMEVLVPA